MCLDTVPYHPSIALLHEQMASALKAKLAAAAEQGTEQGTEQGQVEPPRGSGGKEGEQAQDSKRVRHQ